MALRAINPATRACYLWMMVIALPLGMLLNVIIPGASIRGQSFGILIPLWGTLLSVALWLPYANQGRWNRRAQAALALMLALWGVQLLLTQLDDSSFAYSTFCLPILILLLLLKLPERRDVEIAITLLAFMLAAISVLSLLLGYLSLGPVGFQTTGTRIPMLYSVFGVEGRWFGPFGNENFAGPAGALVMVTGMLLRNSWRWALLSAGVLILLLSQARNSVLAIAIAGTYLTLTSQMVRNSAHRHALQWAASGGVAAATIGYILLRDPTMNGRIPIWQDFVEMWQSNPIQGVGDSGIREYVDTGGHHAVVALTHAHSSFLDILTRYGFVLFLGTIAVLILASRNSLADARRGNRASATILILLIVGSLGETLFSWAYINVQLMSLILVVAHSGQQFNAKTNADAVLLLR